MKRVLIVASDHLLVRRMRRALRGRGYASAGVYSFTDAAHAVDAERVDAVITEVALFDGRGPSLLRQLAAQSPRSIRFAIANAQTDIDASERAVIHSVFVKPFVAIDVLDQLDARCAYEDALRARRPASGPGLRRALHLHVDAAPFALKGRR